MAWQIGRGFAYLSWIFGLFQDWHRTGGVVQLWPISHGLVLAWPDWSKIDTHFDAGLTLNWGCSGSGDV